MPARFASRLFAFSPFCSSKLGNGLTAKCLDFRRGIALFCGERGIHLGSITSLLKTLAIAGKVFIIQYCIELQQFYKI
jgi:hypothetical protein